MNTLTLVIPGPTGRPLRLPAFGPTAPPEPPEPSAWRRRAPNRAWVALTAVFLLAPAWLHAADAEPAREVSFPTPEAAATALGTVAATGDRTALREIFGLAGDDLVATDRVQARNELTEFSEAYATQHRVVHKSDSVCVLEVGANAWPFPIPIAVREGRWHFDLDAGREELLNRRIGRNELAVIEVLHAYVEAQREYARVDRDGDEVLEFARAAGATITAEAVMQPHDVVSGYFADPEGNLWEVAWSPRSNRFDERGVLITG